MVLRHTLHSLANQPQLQTVAQQYGLQLGAKHIIAGTTIEQALQTIRAQQLQATLHYVAPPATTNEEATRTKEQLLATIDALATQNMDAQLAVKLTQLGLLFDVDTCYDHVRDVIELAATVNIFVIIDTEDANTLTLTLEIVEELQKVFENVGTVVQACLPDAPATTERFIRSHLCIVKGHANESLDKLGIDIQYVELLESQLLHGAFTSIATHDENIIEHVKRFVAEHHIPLEQFEFQLLYGFRKQLQQQLAQQGYNVRTYVSFGEDWYSYYMHELAERPQHLSLVAKEVFTKKTNTALAIAAGAFLLGRLTKKK